MDNEYNGPSRHQSRDEREDIEMTKLMPNSDFWENYQTGPERKSSVRAKQFSLSLHQCARNGDESKMKYLLKSKDPPLIKRINQLDTKQFTPLHYAARYNRLNIVKLLVEAGADVQPVGKDEITPLHHAAGYGNDKEKLRKSLISISDEDVCVPPPPPPEIELSEEDIENERMNEAYRAWEERMSVSLDQVEDNEVMRQRGVTGHMASTNHSEHDKWGSVVCYLVSKGANINALDITGQTPLHYAAKRGNEAGCRDLIYFKSKIIIEAKDKQGITPLHLTIVYNQLEIARMLIQAGANLMCKDNEGTTPLHYAAMEGNTELVQMLFDAGDSISEMVIATVNEGLSTPLHLAVENGHYDVAKLLLDNHSGVNKPRENFMYPLHLAVYADVSIAQLLVENHAKIDAVNGYMETALHRASMYDNVEVAKLLIESGACIDKRDEDNYTPLLLAASHGNVKMVELLLQNGANYTVTDNNDKTVVYLAAEKNEQTVLCKLMSYPQIKKLINYSDYCGNNPIHVAAENGYLEIVQCLYKNGAKLDSKNEKEKTPLHLACKFGRTNIVHELFKYDKSILNDEDNNSSTALHIAAYNGNSTVVELLIDKGADVYARNYNGWTPLHLAASEGWEKTCKVLLEYDAPIDCTDKNQVTPLHLASLNGHDEVVKLLLDWSADVTLRDEDGCNCLDRAIDANQTAVAMLLVNSSEWEDVLRNVTTDHVTGYNVTPMRKLIRTMPEVAQRVFDKCMSIKNENSKKNNYEINFNYEFLDDTYASWIQEDIDNKNNDPVIVSGESYISNADTKLTPPILEPYTRDSEILKMNHPLYIMILSERGNLLAHPLVTSLLQHKWDTFGRFFYYLSFFIYIIFLIFLTAYMITTDPPHSYGTDAVLIENNQCGNLTKQYVQPLSASIGTYVIIALAGFNLLKELFQIYQAKLSYFGWMNIIEWIVYVTSLLLVISFNECQRITGYRFEWQWNLGAISVFLVWFGLVLFIQKVPRFGIFVVMFTDICRTFGQFFVVFFLFIVAYAMAFYTALQNRMAFQSIPRSLIKTYVMMIGEFEFDDIFNKPESGIYYAEASYILFIIFVTSMSILVMNLLVGLAVDDIKAVQEKAALTRLAMKVEVVLDVERIIPHFIRQKAFTKEKIIFPNEVYRNPIQRLLMDSYLSPKELQKALHPKLSNMEELKAGQAKLNKGVKKFKKSLKKIKDHNQKLESMLKAIVSAQKIEWHDEDSYDESDDTDGEDDMDEMM